MARIFESGSGKIGRLIHSLDSDVAVTFVAAIVGVDVACFVCVASGVTVGCPCVGVSYLGVGTTRAGVSVGGWVGGGVACGVQAMRRTNKRRKSFFISNTLGGRVGRGDSRDRIAKSP